MLGNALGSTKCDRGAPKRSWHVQEGGGQERKCDRGGQNGPEDIRGFPRESPQPSRDIALRSPPIREAQSAIGVLKKAGGGGGGGATEEQRKQKTINMH